MKKEFDSKNSKSRFRWTTVGKIFLMFFEKIDLAFIVVFIVLLNIFYYTHHNIKQIKENDQLIEHTDKVLFTLNDIYSQAITLRTNRQWYDITESDKYLQIIKALNKTSNADFHLLKTLLKGDRTQLSALDSLSILIASEIKISSQQLRIQENNKIDRRAEGQLFIERVRSCVNSMKEEQLKILSDRNQNKKDVVTQSETYFFSLWSLIMVLLFIFYFLTRRNTTRLRELNNELNTSNYEIAMANEELKESQEVMHDSLVQINSLTANLELKERQYRELVENSTDMIYELDEKGKFSFANLSLEKNSAFSQEELKHKSYWELIREDYKNKVLKFYQQQLKDKVEITYLEFPMITRSNKVMWVGQNARMFFNSSNWVWKVSVVARDITTLVQAREALLESEQNFKSLAHNSPVGIFKINAQGHTVYRNSRWSEICGLKIDAAPEAIQSLIHKEDITTILSFFQRALNQQSTFTLEYRIINPITGLRWITTQGSPLYDAQKNFTGFIGTMEDITIRKDSQEKLAQSEKLYRLLSEKSLDLITLFDLKNVFQYVSPSSEKVLGYKPEELLGRNGFELIHPDDLKNLQAVQSSDLYKDQIVKFRMKRKDEKYIWMEVYSNPVIESNGEVTAIQTSGRDITLRVEVEEALRLERDRAEEATRSKSLFLSMMSHEIRTPMNGVIGLTNLLLKKEPRQDQLNDLNLLKFSGQSLLSIINDILDFSKIEAGKVLLESADFDLHETLLNIKTLFEPEAKEKGILLNFEYDNTLPHIVKGDQIRIGQIVTNLMSNAKKFTQQGGVKLSVSSKGKEANKFKMCFQIQDSGIGIEPDKLSLIFESFAQAQSYTTRKFGGTGLGLTISKQLLQLMGSEIQVKSTVNVGSTFSFTLLLEEGTSRKSEGHQDVDLSEKLKKLKIKILLAEDNPVNQLIACSFFELWGITFDCAEDGLAAVDKVRNKSYHMIFMDLHMPEMDGYEATRTIRNMEDTYFKNIPIIALTASATYDVKDKVLAIGMNDFVTKPFRPEELQAKIAQYFEIEEKAYKDKP